MIKPMLNKSLKELSSMKTGGNVKEVYFPENTQAMLCLVKELMMQNKKYTVLGNMSNVLLPDKGMNIPLVVTTNMKHMCVVSETDTTVTVFAECGVSITKFSFEMCKKGYSGLEFAYGIPGSVGGAVYMNAGAYGGEAKDVITKVVACDKKGNIFEFEKEECEFGYRHSRFVNDEYVILGAEFVLTRADADECTKKAKEIMDESNE